MPWSPQDAKKKYPNLSDKQARTWANVANSALKKCQTDGGSDCDASAIKQANGVVKRSKKSEALGEAALVLVEIGRSISAANSKKLDAAIKAMKDAMEVIAPLIATDADEEVEENAATTVEVPTELREMDRLQNWELVQLDEAAKILAQDDSYDSIRYAVGNALRKRAISDSIKDKASTHSDLGYSDYYDYPSCYIRDLYDGYVVYSTGTELYQCDYSISAGVVTLGNPTTVKVSYVPTTSSSESKTVEITLKGDLIQLNEKAVREDGTARVKLISPGWGSSGYYAEHVLKRDGPTVFPKGLHMYMNHPTEEEDRNRPERDLRDLAGVIASEVKWEAKNSNNTGAGLYADVKVFPTYREFIDEAASHIGVSIRAAGTAVDGEAEGRHGLLVDSLKEGYSVDYVTMAGRGGEVLPLYESVRNKIVSVKIDERGAIVETKSNDDRVVEEVYTVDITKEELDQLREAANKATTLETQLQEAVKQNSEQGTALARMQEAMLLNEARIVVAETLATIQLPDVTRQRIAVNCAKNPPVTEARELDREKLVESVKAAAVAEIKYLEQVGGRVTGGQVVGITTPESNELTMEDADKELEESLKGWGISDASLKVAVNGRRG